jgi:hypothetical protein
VPSRSMLDSITQYCGSQAVPENRGGLVVVQSGANGKKIR